MSAKVVFIGAGSLGFTRGLVRDILTFPTLHDAHIVLVEVNHCAVFGGLGILAREPVFGQTIVNNNDLGFAELLSKRLDESMAGPRPMNGLNAKGNVLNGYCCFHVSPRVKEFASKFDGMAIVLETLRAAFDVHDRVQWCDVAVERNE